MAINGFYNLYKEPVRKWPPLLGMLEHSDVKIGSRFHKAPKISSTVARWHSPV